MRGCLQSSRPAPAQLNAAGPEVRWPCVLPQPTTFGLRLEDGDALDGAKNAGKGQCS